MNVKTLIANALIGRTGSLLTGGQKAAATKARNGLDLSAVAAKAQATRFVNQLAAMRKEARAAA